MNKFLAELILVEIPIILMTRVHLNCTFKFQSVPSYSTLSSFSTIRFLTISSISAFLNLSLNKGSTDGCPIYQPINQPYFLVPDSGATMGMFVRGTLPRMKVESDIELILQKPFSLYYQTTVINEWVMNGQPIIRKNLDSVGDYPKYNF